MAKKMKVLVVDDEDAIRSLLVRIISRDHLVKGAENGEKAIDLVGCERFDVAFVDMKMPGIDGLDTMRELRRIQPDITIVIITGYAENERIEQAIKEGALSCLKKPFHLEEIRTIIQREAGGVKKEGPLNVLAVDDDAVIRKLFEQLNDSDHYHVRALSNAEEVLEAIKENPVDVIFIDIVLPDEDGFKLQEDVKKIAPETKVVFFTGIDEFYEQLHSRINGDIRYSLKKPFDVQKVRDILQRLEAELEQD